VTTISRNQEKWALFPTSLISKRVDQEKEERVERKHTSCHIPARSHSELPVNIGMGEYHI
jgi:hypothetical protein